MFAILALYFFGIGSIRNIFFGIGSITNNFLVSDRYQIFFWYQIDTKSCIIAHCCFSHPAFIYIVCAHTVRTLMESTKLQSRTNRIRSLVSLNSEHSNRLSVICQITRWWMPPPPAAFDVRLWQASLLFSAMWLVLCFPVGHRRQSDKPAQPRHGLPRSVMEVGTTHSTQCEYQSAMSGPVSNPVCLCLAASEATRRWRASPRCQVSLGILILKECQSIHGRT